MIVSSIFVCVLLFVSNASSASCPVQNNQYRTCFYDSIYIIDNYLNITSSDAVLNYVRVLLSQMDLYNGRNVGYIGYGLSEFAGNTEYASGLTTIYQTACADIQVLANLRNFMFQARDPLVNALQKLKDTYNSGYRMTVTLFATTSDENEINQAASYARYYLQNFQFTVVALTPYSRVNPWRDFPAVYQDFQSPANLMQDSYLTTAILNNQCYLGNVTAPTTPTTPPTTPPTTRTTRPPTTSPPVINGSNCDCNPFTSWNDVMLVFDTSASTGKKGLDELLFYTQSIFADFNIQTANNSQADVMHTRLGIVTYGSNAFIQYPLGSLSGTQFANIYSLPYQGSSSADLDSAVQLAAQQLNSSNHRSNARPVIVILSSAYNVGNYRDPQYSITNFRVSGGIVVVYDYVQSGRNIDPMLRKLTNTGYFLTNIYDTDGHDMDRAMCSANCFCGSGMVSYITSNVDETPQEKCYYPVNIQTNLALAKNRCARLNNGLVAMGKTADKTRFLQNLFSIVTNFWGGLVWDQYNYRYTWMDGTPVDGSYQPWYQWGGHQQGTDCVYVTSSYNGSLWVQTDCRNVYDIACEMHACDSTHYCY